jgi:hypothetical protein
MEIGVSLDDVKDFIARLQRGSYETDASSHLGDDGTCLSELSSIFEALNVGFVLVDPKRMDTLSSEGRVAKPA